MNSQKLSKAVLHAMYAEIVHKAEIAGAEAFNSCKPTPMGVYSSDLMGNRLSETEWVDDGVCGFAWVHIKGNTSFGRWAKKQGIASKDYYGGLNIRVSSPSQSYERKMAYARAYAKVLKECQIDAYADGRLD